MIMACMQVTVWSPSTQEGSLSRREAGRRVGPSGEGQEAGAAAGCDLLFCEMGGASPAAPHSPSGLPRLTMGR